METEKESVYNSLPSEPDDDFWLEQGKKIQEGSLSSVREGAKALMTGLGLLKAIYLGILSFSEFIPKSMILLQKFLFILPLVFWLAALHQSLEVMMTKSFNINLNSPDDIRTKSTIAIVEKQRNLQRAFWMLTIGLLVALILLIVRTRM